MILVEDFGDFPTALLRVHRRFEIENEFGSRYNRAPTVRSSIATSAGEDPVTLPWLWKD
jgi:hypothetical protein